MAEFLDALVMIGLGFAFVCLIIVLAQSWARRWGGDEVQEDNKGEGGG